MSVVLPATLTIGLSALSLGVTAMVVRRAFQLRAEAKEWQAMADDLGVLSDTFDELGQ